MTDYDARLGYNKRYKERHEQGCPGWANAESYEKKKTEIDRLISRHAIPEGGRFLELGCGNGNMTLYAASRGLDAHGLDVIPEAIAWAEENAKDKGLAGDFQLGSVVDLKEYPDDSFDLVYDGDCLHCVIGEDRTTCMGNIFRILKPGGILHAKANCFNASVTERCEIASDCYFDPDTQCLMRNGVPYYYLSREDELQDRLCSAGFLILGVEKIEAFEGKEPYQSCWLQIDAQRLAQ